MFITYDLLDEIADDEIVRRGKKYYEEGRVDAHAVSETHISAKVR